MLYTWIVFSYFLFVLFLFLPLLISLLPIQDRIQSQQHITPENPLIQACAVFSLQYRTQYKAFFDLLLGAIFTHCPSLIPISRSTAHHFDDGILPSDTPQSFNLIEGLSVFYGTLTWSLSKPTDERLPFPLSLSSLLYFSVRP